MHPIKDDLTQSVLPTLHVVEVAGFVVSIAEIAFIFLSLGAAAEAKRIR